MDINCTYNCMHQVNGKCTLQIPSNISACFDIPEDVDCLYYVPSFQHIQINNSNKESKMTNPT